MKLGSTFCLLLIVVGACSSNASDDGSGSGSDAAGGGEDGTCPPNVTHAIPCDVPQLGVTCAGIASCLCGTEGISVESTCVCQESELNGRAWHCGDECAQSCASGGAGGGGGGGGGADPVEEVDCSDLCAHFARTRCVQSTSGCEANCLRVVRSNPQCESEIQAYLQCAVVARIVCTLDEEYVEGCDNEMAVLEACLN